MPLSREANAARMREQREARSAVTQKELADEAADFAAAIAPVPPEVYDATRKRREREDAAQAQAAKKVKLQDAVFPTSDAERKKESYEPSSEAHGGSREHAGRPRELSRKEGSSAIRSNA